MGIDSLWTLVRALACNLEAVYPSYDNNIIDSRNRFLDNPNSWKNRLCENQGGRTIEDSDDGVVN